MYADVAFFCFLHQRVVWDDVHRKFNSAHGGAKARPLHDVHALLL
jgi:hypothetical protein